MEAGIEPDEVLILLWDAGFAYVKTAADRLPRREANRARRVLGVATRREICTPDYWQSTLGLSRTSLEALLRDLGVVDPFDGSSLRKRAIHRLQSELRLRKRNHADLCTAQPETGPFEWETVGHERDLVMLSAEEVLRIHYALVADFKNAAEPIQPPGVKNEGLLGSAVGRPATSLGNTLKYPTVEMAAAALFHSLVHNHPFHNGNKRTALVSMLVFMDENGMLLTCDEDELFRMVLQVAQHSLVDGPRSELADREVLTVARWIKEHSRWTEKGDRALAWRRLEQLLNGYGCRFERAGSTVTIVRRVSRRIRFMPIFSKERTLRSQVQYGGAGRELSGSVINRLRRDLELDDNNGVDSAAFYEDARISTSDFIARYRKTLNRLSRL